MHQEAFLIPRYAIMVIQSEPLFLAQNCTAWSVLTTAVAKVARLTKEAMMSTLLLLTAVVLILWLGMVLIFDPDGFRSARPTRATAD